MRTVTRRGKKLFYFYNSTNCISSILFVEVDVCDSIFVVWFQMIIKTTKGWLQVWDTWYGIIVLSPFNPFLC